MTNFTRLRRRDRGSAEQYKIVKKACAKWLPVITSTVKTIAEWRKRTFVEDEPM